MIQRIQSVYLLVVTILLASVFAYPYAELLSSGGQLFIFNFNGLSIESEEGMYLLTIPPMILLAIITLVSFVTIFYIKSVFCK